MAEDSPSIASRGRPIRNAMSEKSWYYSRGRNRAGPVSLEDLASRGAVDAATLVWQRGMETWQPASNVLALAHVVAHLPPPLPDLPGPKREAAPAVAAKRRPKPVRSERRETPDGSPALSLAKSAALLALLIPVMILVADATLAFWMSILSGFALSYNTVPYRIAAIAFAALVAFVWFGRRTPERTALQHGIVAVGALTLYTAVALVVGGWLPARMILASFLAGVVAVGTGGGVGLLTAGRWRPAAALAAPGILVFAAVNFISSTPDPAPAQCEAWGRTYLSALAGPTRPGTMSQLQQDMNERTRAARKLTSSLERCKQLGYLPPQFQILP